ncbi:MAG: DUF5810 domain-containing protein [Halobacteriaceae archaeon]
MPTGYRCPVCEAPQPDLEHLANHLAFTAMLGDERHETWLDEHTPEWAELAPAGLGEVLSDRVEAVDIDGVGTSRDGQNGADFGESDRPDVDVESASQGPSTDTVDPVTAAALEEARALTESSGDEGETTPEEQGEDG